MDAQKSSGQGCLSFPQVLMEFDPRKAPDPEVTRHLRECPRCWNLFDSVIYADASAVREVLAKPELIASSAFRKEIEQLFTAYLYSYLRDPELLDKIRNRIAEDADDNDLDYLNRYLHILSATKASARERADEMRKTLDDAAKAAKPNEHWIRTATIYKGRIELGRKRAADFKGIGGKERIYEIKEVIPEGGRMAAGDGADDTEVFLETLPNGWECEIIYKGGGKDTELIISCDGPEYPVLEVYPLPGFEEAASYNSPVQMLEFSELCNNRPVYYLDGSHGSILIIPGIPEAYKIFTLEYVRNRSDVKRR